MRVTKVGYGLGVTINIGDYQSHRPGSYVEVELNEGDDVDKAMELSRQIALKAFIESEKDCNTVIELSDRYKAEFIDHVAMMIEDEPGD